MSRSPRRALRNLLALAVAALGVGSMSTTPVAAASTSHIPTAFTSHGYRATGPLFPHGVSGTHTCTASVVHSTSHDLLLTAAHCLRGTGVGWSFVPMYSSGSAPYGVWTVVHAYLPPAWVQRQDPRHDYAVLQVARRTIDGRSRGVEDVVGGYRIGSAHSGEAMRAPGYNSGRNDRPISCGNRSRTTGSYPTFDCHGYRGGSSGSPWLVDVPGSSGHEIHGLIGGLHHGGCYEYTSYSSPFTSDTTALVARAVARQHPDTAPAPGDDGC